MLAGTTVILPCLAVLAACGGAAPENLANSAGASEPIVYKTGDVVSIDAPALTAEVVKDADAATKRYHDATIRVSGKVATIHHADRTGITVVTLEDGHFNSVIAGLAKGTPWREMKVGQQHTFECKLMGAYLATSMFDGKCKPV